MTTQSDLEDRLQSALARITNVANALPDAGAIAAQADEMDALRSKIEAERSTNEELVQRVKALKDRQENQVAELEASLEQAKTGEAEKSVVAQELKARVEELRDQVARLTEANRAMVGDPELVNTSMMAELDAMRASRRADVTEINDIIAQLEPHLEGDAHA